MSARALDALRKGEVAIIATDTVYGLAALPGSAGYRTIFELKERPADQVLPWLVSGPSALDTFACEVPMYARNLAEMFWPGALTLVVRASSAARELGCIAPDGTVALRSPDAPQVLDLVAQLGCPIACTSANKHGMPAASSIDNIPSNMRALPGGDELAAVQGTGHASTIVDCTGAIPRILRAGPISAQVVLDVACYGVTLI